MGSRAGPYAGTRGGAAGERRELILEEQAALLAKGKLPERPLLSVAIWADWQLFGVLPVASLWDLPASVVEEIRYLQATVELPQPDG